MDPQIRSGEKCRLLMYRFPPESALDGRVLGSLERAFGGGALRILDLLFVAREAGTGELMALTGRGRGEGSLVASLIGFRLDAAQRARATTRAVRAYPSADGSDLVTRLAAAVAPGGAIAALLVADAWGDAVDEAARGSGGSPLLDEPVPETRLGGLEQRLVEAATSPGVAQARSAGRHIVRITGAPPGGASRRSGANPNRS